MNNLLRLIIFVLLLPICNYCCFAQGKIERMESYEKGKIEAAANIVEGIYLIKAWGLSSPTIGPLPSAEDVYYSILKEKYKITYDWVGGCMVDDETLDYAGGYNEVSRAGIEAKYGKGILEKVREQAEEEHERKYGEKEREFYKKMKEGLESLPKRNGKGYRL